MEQFIHRIDNGRALWRDQLAAFRRKPPDPIENVLRLSGVERREGWRGNRGCCGDWCRREGRHGRCHRGWNRARCRGRRGRRNSRRRRAWRGRCRRGWDRREGRCRRWCSRRCRRGRRSWNRASVSRSLWPSEQPSPSGLAWALPSRLEQDVVSRSAWPSEQPSPSRSGPACRSRLERGSASRSAWPESGRYRTPRPPRATRGVDRQVASSSCGGSIHNSTAPSPEWFRPGSEPLLRVLTVARATGGTTLFRSQGDVGVAAGAARCPRGVSSAACNSFRVDSPYSATSELSRQVHVSTLSGSTSSQVSLCQINCRCNTSEAWKKTSAVPWQPWG